VTRSTRVEAFAHRRVVGAHSVQPATVRRRVGGVQQRRLHDIIKNCIESGARDFKSSSIILSEAKKLRSMGAHQLQRFFASLRMNDSCLRNT